MKQLPSSVTLEMLLMASSLFSLCLLGPCCCESVRITAVPLNVNACQPWRIPIQAPQCCLERPGSLRLSPTRDPGMPGPTAQRVSRVLRLFSRSWVECHHLCRPLPEHGRGLSDTARLIRRRMWFKCRVSQDDASKLIEVDSTSLSLCRESTSSPTLG